MDLFFQSLTDLGTAALGLFWLPVIIWTLIALTAVILLHLFEHKISAGYQYHCRVALLWGLAAGMAGSALLYLFPFTGTESAVVNAKFIVFQNPIAITASAPESALNWTEPALWAGIATALILIAALIGLLKLAADLIQLNLFSNNLQQADADLKATLTTSNRQMLDRSLTNISFSDEVAVPCTFGWGRKRIVLPPELRQEPEKLNMAIRHELTHIINNDYLINTTVQTVKALFFFHPLVHRLAAGIEEYREMHCDQHVLQDAAISQKNYAKLLLELSPKTVFKTQSSVVNMAVHPSTLKKRIQTMMTSNRPIPSLKWSLSLMITLTLLLGGLMACSDMEEGGITQTEVEQTQADMSTTANLNEPLYILNGEQMDSPGNKNIMARLKPKYIKSIDVLKGESATSIYGQKGKNGVVQIKVLDKEAAMSDLRSEDEMNALNKKGYDGPRKEIFVAVENPPEIIGGQRAVYNNLTYPQKCSEANVEGRVILQFVVNKQGNVENAKVVRGIGSGCDKAALNAVNSLQFKPGTQRGEAVNTQFSLPIMFQLPKDDTSGQK